MTANPGFLQRLEDYRPSKTLYLVMHRMHPWYIDPRIHLGRLANRARLPGEGRQGGWKPFRKVSKSLILYEPLSMCA